MKKSELRELEKTNCHQAVWIKFVDGSEGLYFFYGVDEDGDGDFHTIDYETLEKGDKPFSFSPDFMSDIRVAIDPEHPE